MKQHLISTLQPVAVLVAAIAVAAPVQAKDCYRAGSYTTRDQAEEMADQLKTKKPASTVTIKERDGKFNVIVCKNEN